MWAVGKALWLYYLPQLSKGRIKIFFLSFFPSYYTTIYFYFWPELLVLPIYSSTIPWTPGFDTWRVEEYSKSWKQFHSPTWTGIFKKVAVAILPIWCSLGLDTLLILLLAYHDNANRYSGVILVKDLGILPRRKCRKQGIGRYGQRSEHIWASIQSIPPPRLFSALRPRTNTFSYLVCTYSQNSARLVQILESSNISGVYKFRSISNRE